MTNSTIRARVGSCADCHKPRTLIAGRCQICYKKFRAQICQKRQKFKTTKRMLTMSTTNIELSGEELRSWYAHKMNIIARKPFCVCCKAFIPEAYYLHAVAHVMPKNIFKSVATHPNNFLILGAGCCHGIYDSSIERASKMPIFPLAVLMFKKFEHLITEKHKHLDLFIQYAKELGYY